MSTAPRNASQQGSSYLGTAPLGSAAAIRLIAGRELATRLRSKAFTVLTSVVLVIIVGMVLAFYFLAGSGFGVTKVGVLSSDTAVAAQVEAAATSVGQQVSVEKYADAAAGREAVADGDIDAFVTEDADALTAVVNENLDVGLHTALTALAQQLALSSEVSALGGDPATVTAAVAAAQVTVEPLTPPRTYDGQQLFLGAATGILIYLSLLVGGQMVAQGVVEEKSSRVVELLLATVRPWELMAGKVAGIGALGLIQIVLYGVVGVGLASALGVLTLAISAAAGTVIWLIVWYLIGFIMYAFAFAGAGALVSRQEDAAGVVMPITSVVIVGYVIGISILPSDPTNSFAEVMSVIPIFSPMIMPMRLAMGGVPAWEAALSVALALAMIPLLAVISGRMYRNGVVHSGSRMALRRALAR